MKALILIFLIIPAVLFGQTSIKGVVRDINSHEGIAFANLLVVGSTVGTTTNIDGTFTLNYKGSGTKLEVSFIGYQTDTISFKLNQENSLKVFLRPASQELDEIKFVAPKYDNPNKELFKRIVKNKKSNSMESLDYYECEVYNKIQVDLNQIGKFVKNHRIKSLDYMYDMIDTSVERSESFLPVFLSETVSNYYSTLKPKSEKEIILASKTSGLENESVSMLLGNTTTDFNLYTNFIYAFEKEYVSPISDFGWIYFKYEIVDTAYVGPYLSYQVSFKPRRKQEPTFYGTMWVDADSYAVTKIDMSLSEDANVNFINALKITREYARIEGHWVKQSEYMEVDANVLKSDKLMGVFMHKTTYWKDPKINFQRESSFYSNTERTALSDSALNRSSDYWDQKRGEQLSEKETLIYTNIDSLVDSKPFKWGLRLTKMFYTGYLPFESFEFGPYYSTYSFNSIEGNRFRLGGRTKSKFHDKLRLSGYLAFGTTDDMLKGQLKAEYYFSKNPLTRIEAEYSRDYRQLSDSPDAFEPDNIMSSLSRRTAPQFTLVDKKNISFLKEWKPGISNQLKIFVNDYYPVAQLQFYNPINMRIPHFRVSAIEFTGRVAIGEKFVMGDFSRVSLGTKKPIISYGLGYSNKSFINSDYDYVKGFVQVKDKFLFGTLGRLELVVDASKIWGELPYPILLQHPGNSSYYFDKFAFNLMGPSEFVSDEFVSVKAEYHLEGFVLNKVPLIRKLKWRELAYARSVIGDVKNNHESIMLFPEGLKSLNGQPYAEVGIGIENIFKLIRVDYIVRVTHRGTSLGNNGLFAGLQLDL